MEESSESVVARAEEADRLIQQWRSGSQEAFNQLFALFHQDFRTIAHRLFARERLNHTLQTDELVNQFYMKITRGKTIPWTSYLHFLRGSSRVMRQILIDHARSWNVRPTGRDGQPFADAKEGAIDLAQPKSPDILNMVALSKAVDQLTEHDAELGQLADLHLIAGLTMEEIGQCRGLSTSKVKRQWALAKKFLMKKL